MNRREALEKTSWILTSVLVAPAVLGALQACQQEASSTRNLLVLTDQQDDLVRAISDTIIPKTQSPGASEVQVNQFIDLLLKDVFEEEVKQNFLDGLAQFDQDCQSATGKTFTKLSETERFRYLEKVDRAVMGKEYGKSVPFYYTFKQLTVSVYLSTEAGVKQNLNYVPIPGPFQANVEFKKGDKIMVGNQM